MKFSVIMTTTKSRKEAKKIANMLLESKLAACCNIIGGIDSFFRWKGETYALKENLLIIKTRSSLSKRVTEKISEIHSYETPSIEVIPFSAALKPMERWLLSETR
jgi:periplasmic divalent cation tolerance protein